MFAGRQAGVNGFVHWTGHAWQFANDFVQVGKACLDKVTQISHPLHGGFIPEGIGKHEDDFAHTGFLLIKKKATKYTEALKNQGTPCALWL